MKRSTAVLGREGGHDAMLSWQSNMHRMWQTPCCTFCCAFLCVCTVACRRVSRGYEGAQQLGFRERRSRGCDTVASCRATGSHEQLAPFSGCSGVCRALEERKGPRTSSSTTEVPTPVPLNDALLPSLLLVVCCTHRHNSFQFTL